MPLMIVLAGIVLQVTSGTAAAPARIELVAGGGTTGEVTSTANEAKITSPFGVGFDAAGTLYFVEMVGNRVRKLGPDGLVTTLAGTGRKGSGGDDGPAAQAELNGPHSLAVARNGDILVADTWNNRVRKIDARSGRITNIAGTGHKGFSGDGGPATQAEFGGIYCLALRRGRADARPGRPRQSPRAPRRPEDRDRHDRGGQRQEGRARRRRRRALGPAGRSRGPSRSTAGATSTSSNAAATPFGSSIGRARSAPSPAPANRATRATAATPARRG